MSGSFLRPQLDHEPVRIHQLRRNHVDRPLQIENHPRRARIHLRKTNFLQTMIAHLERFDAVMSRSGRSQPVQIEIKTRRVLDLIGGQLIRTLRLNCDARDIAKRPEADSFDVRIDSRLRRHMRRHERANSGNSTTRTPTAQQAHMTKDTNFVGFIVTGNAVEATQAAMLTFGHASRRVRACRRTQRAHGPG